jgi:hypothetical protein
MGRGRRRLVNIKKSVIDEAAHNHRRKSLVERRLDYAENCLADTIPASLGWRV